LLPESPPRPKPLILVVDDDAATRSLCRSALESDGYEIVEAEDGEAALHQFESRLPDLVILDVTLRDADGYETLERIRAHPDGLRTPVVMTPSPDDTASIERAYAFGTTDFITKPIQPVDLTYRVRYILRGSRTAEALADSRRRLAEAQRVARLGRWEWNLITDRMLVTDEVTRLLGEFYGPLADFLRLVHADDRIAVQRALHETMELGHPYEGDHRFTFPGGEERFVHARGIVTRDAAGRPARLSGTIQNITHRKAMEQRLVETERLSAMGEMAGEIGHEINNYLMAIGGRAELIPMAVERNDNDKVVYSARVIAEQVARMRVLTDGLLDAARSESSPVPVDLNELVDRTLEFVKPQNKYDDVTFDVRRDGRPLPIYADPQQIQQVLLNLLSNAADAMHARQGSTRTLRLQAGEDGSEIVLEVADDGVGIDSATLGRIFEPRFTTKATGNGFGLSVCHRIVSNHRGRVAVQSTPGAGTVFSVRLPVHAAAPRPVPALVRD
jgi:signal transduction histidine kinase